jgi:DNA-binding response OmpR family regulator
VRVLVVEDERKLARVLASALNAEHYDVVVAPTGEDGFFRVHAEAFDLVLIDLMLPGRSGLEILQTFRKRQVQTPVLILTARDGVDDRVLGLDLSADDYLDLTAREFDLLEYLLRHRGHVVSREMLARDVWKEPRRATPIDNVIDVQMTRLRRKIDTDGQRRLIRHTRRARSRNGIWSRRRPGARTGVLCGAGVGATATAEEFECV